MGRGNVCVHGPCEGLYYIDNDDFQVYCLGSETKLLRELDYTSLVSGNWEYDADLSEHELGDILGGFMESFTGMFPSFARTEPGVWISRSRRAILENTLFYIAIEDNEWSVAVELLQKDFEGCANLFGLQQRHYKSYLLGLEKCLLEILPSIGTYTGPWTSGRIQRQEPAAS